MASKFATENVISVHHWNDKLFSFRTTRKPGLRFRNGEFIMLGLGGENQERPLMRAYSVASANHEDYLEFFSIKVENGALTSKLQHLQASSQVLIGSKPTGTLVVDDLSDAKNLFLFSTGTGLAPFLSIIKDPEIYQRFEKVILFHGVRYVSELAYYHWLNEAIYQDELFAEMVGGKLIYYPSVTREAFRNQGRLTQLLENGKLCKDLGLPPLNPVDDRIMLCGSPSMLTQTREIIDSMGFQASAKMGVRGDYVVERAFVER